MTNFRTDHVTVREVEKLLNHIRLDYDRPVSWHAPSLDPSPLIRKTSVKRSTIFYTAPRPDT